MVYIICSDYFLNPYIEKSLDKKVYIKKIIIKEYKNLFFKLIKKIIIFFYGLKPFLNISSLQEIEIGTNDTVIFFDIIDPKILKEILNFFPCKRKIFWIWNTIDKKQIKNIDYLKKISKDIWTFDEKDAEKYKLKFREQFHFIEISDMSLEEKNQLFFIGIDKGRIEKIKNLDRIFNNFFNIKTKILIKKDKFKRYKKEEQKYFINNLLPYEEVTKELKSSKYILDIVKEGQTGLTLRVLEAVFYCKKLITNNKEIIKYDFYNPNNILIIEDMNKISQETIKKISEFVEIEYERIDKSILKKYMIENWLETILQKN